MIPYFTPPSLQLGPLALQPFGVVTAIGVLAGVHIATVQSRKANLDSKLLSDFALWGLIAGVVVGHLVHLFFYHPEELSKSPFQIFKVWDGLSSSGGLLGGILAAAVFFRRRKVPFAAYADVLALAVSVGWGIARIGCFLVHDHPGVRTDFFLAVEFPGGARHDLGLYDALVLFSSAAILFYLRKRRLFEGELLSILAILYGTARFFLDFLRARDLAYVDARYFGLTPAQYGMVALVIYGVYRLARWRSRTAGTGSAAPPPA